MKRVEAETLEEAYSKAARELNCSVTELNYEIIQHPTSGVMGLFKKTAIIIAVKKIKTEKNSPIKDDPKVEVTEKREFLEKSEEAISLKEQREESREPSKRVDGDLNLKGDRIVDQFFTDNINSIASEDILEEKVIYDDDRDTPENRALSLEIEKKIQNLIRAGCFEIDTVEVDVFNGIAHIFIDGDDAALLIGKEGYRYNAFSYMLFNWINAEYNLYIKLEIAEFIQAQEEMIDSYLKPIAEHIRVHGRGKTKPLDGILVQIALEKLRAMFPNKYIAIKTGKDGKKFIIINDFNTKKN